MNDFTKEELEALADSYEQRLHGGYVIHMELLHKIQSMIENYCVVKPEPKYKIGDEVWHLSEVDQLDSFIIKTIDFDEKESEYLYSHSEKIGCAWLESQLFPTREDVIEHQIEYWTSLRDNAVTENHDRYNDCL